MHTLATMPWMYSVHIYVWWTKVHGYSIYQFYLLLSKPHALYIAKMKHSQLSKSHAGCGTHFSMLPLLCATHYETLIMVGQTELSTQAYMHYVILIYELRTHQLEDYNACT